MPQEFPAIRLVALDLDGTLLNREGHVTPRTRAALQAAVDKGVYIVPATGRPLASLPPEVAQLPGIRYVITCNGAAVWDLGSDPVGAVYSRYSNAKEHRTSTPVCLLHSLMPVETAREAFAVCESCHADLRIFSDGYACTDARSIALAAARAAKKDGTEAHQPNDGRFTILRDAAEWMSRNAFAIEKLCVFLKPAAGCGCAAPLPRRPGRRDRTGVAEKRGGDRRRCGQGRGAARTGRPAGHPPRMHPCGGRQRERPRHAAKGRCGRCDGQRYAGDPGAGAPCQQGRLRP